MVSVLVASVFPASQRSASGASGKTRLVNSLSGRSRFV